MWIQVFLASVLVANIVATQCPGGYTLYAKENTCVKAHSEPKTFLEARAICKRESGGDLVKVLTPYKHSFVRQLQSTPFWMGLWDPQHKGRFFYMDGYKVTFYRPWKGGRPQGRSKSDNCAFSNNGNWENGNCDVKRAFVCEKKIIGCQPGWNYFAGDSTCLKSNGMVIKTYFDATKACNAEGADVTMVRSQAKADFINEIHVLYYWVGLDDLDRNQQFQYVDGTSLGLFAPWMAGEPNNAGGKENCVQSFGRVSDKYGRWNDITCTRRTGFVCQKPNGCPEGYVYYRGSNTCLRLYGGAKQYAHARKVCQDDGGDLVQIQNEEKAKFITGFAAIWYWVGVVDARKNRHFVRSDGSPLGAYKPWAKGEPNNAGHGEYCVIVMGTFSPDVGKWRDENCYKEVPFICEVKNA